MYDALYALVAYTNNESAKFSPSACGEIFQISVTPNGANTPLYVSCGQHVATAFAKIGVFL